MLFNTATFALFFAIVFALYHVLRRRAQNVLLLASSYLFYGWWDWRFCGLLALSTIVDFEVGRRLGAAAGARRKRLLLTSMTVNLGVLGAFKYFGFFVDSLSDVAAALGIALHAPMLHIVLPVGISFYTFQTMAYTIDVYRRRLEPTNDLVAFAVYVAYFPQLVAGPIERAQRLLPQIQQDRRVDANALSSGALLFLIGLLRKVVIADNVAPIVDEVFAAPASHPSGHVLLGVFLFGLQIYSDFAGYSDMARGISRMFGIELIENFQRPYFAVNITDFWRRWHVSLSQWLRDYLYIPLGGNRRGRLMAYRNLFLTMFLGGLWHGAAWTFVAWGVLHGAALALHKAVMGRVPERSERTSVGALGPFARAVGWFSTMVFVWVAWTFFRARDFDNAAAVFGALADWHAGASWHDLYTALLYVALVLLIDVPQQLTGDHCAWLRWPAPVRGLFYALALLLIASGWITDAAPFIYFQF